MRMRNIWFDGLSVLVAVLMAGCVVFSIVDYMREKDAGLASLVGTALVVGLFLLLAVFYFWMSLRVGDIQRRVREMRKKGDGHRSDLKTEDGIGRCSTDAKEPSK